MERFETLLSRAVVLLQRDIDTDQIIPARFLTTTSRTGLGKHLFSDWRYLPSGAERPGFALNRPEARSAAVLIAGANFGCGSSREHAPWALVDFGFRAVVAPSFADIFRNNALKNGLLPVEIDEASHARLASLVSADPSASLTVDLSTQTLSAPGGLEASFQVEPFARRCLLEGVDELGYLLAREPAIAAFEAKHEAREAR